MYEIFELLLKKHGVTTYQVAKATGISTASFTGWKQGKWNFKADKLQKVADYFGVSLNYLLTGKENQESDPAIYTDDHDIKKHIDMIMESLDGKDVIVYEGQKIDLNEQSRRMLRYAMEIAYEAAKNNIIEQEGKENKK